MIDFEKMPNFLVIGVSKCGTTTLYDIARQHPEIFVSQKKEPNFYSRDDLYQKGLEWYVDAYFGDAVGYTARGEASPSYFWRSRETAERIQTAYHEHPLRLIVIFRNPAQRAYSAYWHSIRNGSERLSFEAALRAEEKWLSTHPGISILPWEQRHNFYNGLYATHLKPFLEHFERQHFLFLLTEDLINDFTGTAYKLYNFLGVNANFQVQSVVRNPARQYRVQRLRNSLRDPSDPLRRVARSALQLFPARLRERWKKRILEANLKPEGYPPMKESTRRELISRYTGEIKELEVLISRDLSEWYNLEEVLFTE